MSVSTQWFSVESPQAWIPQSTSHNLFHIQDYSNQDYTNTTLDEFWFKLPSNTSSSSLNWNDFVPSSPAMSSTGRTPTESYLGGSSIWDPAPYKPAGISTLKLNELNASAETYPSVYSTSPTSSGANLLSPRNLVDIEVELSRQNLYKTELCRSWLESALCKYGNKCQFAHGQHELRPVIRHPKYKTEICKTFHTNGTCPYGKRCRFVHNPAELRSPSLSSSESLESLPLLDDIINSETSPDEEMRQLQERFKLANIAPDPVFNPSQSFIPLPQNDSGSLDDVSSPHSGPSKKGSGLPFFQILRKQKI